MKIDCFECRWSHSLDWSHRTECRHINKRSLNVKVNEHRSKGKFGEWPSNFEPEWLDNCDHFIQKVKPILERRYDRFNRADTHNKSKWGDGTFWDQNVLVGTRRVEDRRARQRTRKEVQGRLK